MSLRPFALAAVLAAGGLLAPAATAQTPPAEGRFVADTVRVEGRVYPYAVYLPPGYPDGRRWPAVLVLHGAGSRGTDGLRPRTQSVVEAARRYPERYRAILVLPQCPPGTRWLGAPARAAWRALERARARYAVDSTRVYLAGQSMGADGGFELAARHADRLAAFVAVALGWGEPDFDPAALRALPVRVFHGAEDRIPVARARARVARLRAAGHPDAVLREYPGRGHEIFDEVYRDSTVSGWLFRQRRAEPPRP